jgi:hypothetical protein
VVDESSREDAIWDLILCANIMRSTSGLTGKHRLFESKADDAHQIDL